MPADRRVVSALSGDLLYHPGILLALDPVDVIAGSALAMKVPLSHLTHPHLTVDTGPVSFSVSHNIPSPCSPVTSTPDLLRESQNLRLKCSKKPTISNSL